MGEPTDRGPYRTPLGLADTPPAARRAPWVVALVALTLGALHTARVAPPPTAPRIPPGDAVAFGAPVLHASALVGHTLACALTRLQGGRQQLVCEGARTVTVRGETRAVPQAWPADDIVRVVPASDRTGGQRRHEPHDPRAFPDVVATGLRRDGRWVSFDRDAAEPRVIDLPSAGARGAVVELQFVAEIVHWGRCGSDWGEASAWVARTADGSLLWMNGARDPAVWRSILGAEARVAAVAIDGFHYCATSRAGEVRCGAFPRSALEEVVAPHLLESLTDRTVEEVSLRATLVCTRSPTAGVRCDHLPGASAVTARTRGLQGPVAAMALGRSDLCVADAHHAWWCAHGPLRDDPRAWWRDEVTSLVLEPAPALIGARDVTLTDEGGCARWSQGQILCWGRAARGGSVRSRAQATEIAALRGATALEVKGGRPYALVGGNVRAMRTPFHDPELGRGVGWFDDPLREPAHAMSLSGYWGCVAGAGVRCWRVDDDTLASSGFDLPLGAARGAVRALVTHEDVGCVRTDGGEVWCWSHRSPHPNALLRASALEGGEALVGYDRAVCSVRGGRFVGCYPADPSNPSPAPGSLWLPEKDLTHKFPAALGALVSVDMEVLDGCALGATGRVACPSAFGGSYEVVAGVERARSVSGNRDLGCALTDDARALCWGTNVDGFLTAEEAARRPRLFPFIR